LSFIAKATFSFLFNFMLNLPANLLSTVYWCHLASVVGQVASQRDKFQLLDICCIA